MQIERRLEDPAPLTPAALGDLVLDALDLGLFEAIVRRVEAALVAVPADARLHQLLGLAKRELLDGAGAVSAFERAAALAPGDPLIAHGLARSTWEAGLPATERYATARRLAPSDAGILIGQAASLVSAGRGGEAETGLAQVLGQNPGWYDGHAAYARIVAASCSGTDGTATVRTALAQFPADASLWRLFLRLLLDARRYAEALEIARAASARLGPDQEWQRGEAIALSEQGKAVAAQAIFDRLRAPLNAGAIVHPVRNLIRLGRFDEALALAGSSVPEAEEPVLWPYRALLWRMTGDERWAWLEGDQRLIGVYDLGFSVAQLGELAEVLRNLHRRSGLLPDQSVRGGTQTDGNLLARAEPEIVSLRRALLDTVARHVAQLPPPVRGHPTLVERRSPLRVAGSWSVRLCAAGFHVDHVHPRGWLSSAFYVALPDPLAPVDQSGWLTFGECRALLPDLAAFRTVEPVAGQLVLFPSTTWHGTKPFAAGERMTVAFDIARP